MSETRQESHPLRDRLVGLIVAASFVAALWFVLADSERRSSVASLGFDGTLVLVALAATGSVLVSLSWAAVAGRHAGSRETFTQYLVYQPAKYLPGGIAQSLLQMSHVHGAVGSWRRSSGVFVAHMAVLVVGGAVVAVPSALERFGVGTLLFAVAGVLVAFMVAARATRRSSMAIVVPGPAELATGVFAAGAGLTVWGVAFGVAITSVAGGDFSAGDISTFSLAWLAGFLALPIPAGIGVREAVLVGLSYAGAEAVLTASIVVRLAVASAEIGLAGLAVLLGRGQ